MSEYLRLFTDAPFAVFAATALLFVLRLRARWWGKAMWLAWLAFCCSIYWAFRRLGHANMSPDFPAGLIWFWTWAYCGAMLLVALAVVCPWRFRHWGWILPVVAWGISAWGLWNAVKVPDVHELTFAFHDLPAELDGYRIVQISDLHASCALRAGRTRAIVDRVNALGADLICLTGDYGDGNADRYHDFLEPLRDLKAKDGVWAVSGNHEWFPFHVGWMDWCERYGLRFLANECVFPRRSLALGGVHDREIRHPRVTVPHDQLPDVERTFAAATNGEFRVLLDHQALDMKENLTRHKVRLQLSGHTHGGIMPGMASVVKRLNGGFLRGVYREGDAILYVSSGCGQGASFLVRLFDPTEIALITLRRMTERAVKAGWPES